MLNKKRILYISLICFFLFLISGCIPKVSPQDNPPQVNITYPAENSIVSGNVTITANASDDKGINKVEIYIDNDKFDMTKSGDVYTYAWDTGSLTVGTDHKLKAKAYDTKGQTSESTEITVTIGMQNVNLTFVDHFEGSTNNEGQYTSPFYEETINSNNNISFVSGKSGQGVHLDALDSYICYSGQYLNPCEGTIRYYFKPDENYQTVYYDPTQMNDHFEAFLIDTVGWLGAFNGALWNGLQFLKDPNTNEKTMNMIFGTWSGDYWSYAIAQYINLPTDQFTEIAIAWNKDEGKIKIYLNGTKITEADYNTDINNTELFFIGQNPFGSHWPYGPHSMMGTYDELEIYNVDISKLY